MTKLHPKCKFTPPVYICTGVYIVHMNDALKGATYHVIHHSGFERVPTNGRVLDFIAFKEPLGYYKNSH